MRSRWILEGARAKGWVRVWAPAKLNLTLKVLRRLPSGYHEIESLMVPVTLADEVKVAVSAAGGDEVEISCDDPSVPTGEDNLVYRAVQALRASGVPARSLSVFIRKRIPAGGGLGGGSSDAAAVMKGIDYLSGCDLPVEALRQAGLRVGADVPFFFMEQACLAEGIGEKLSPLEISHDVWFLIGFPGIAISTKRVYEALDLELTKQEAQVNMPFNLKGDTPLDGGGWALVNDLESPVFVWYPSLGEFCNKLKILGALEARMTGSGSSIFGVFKDKAAAMAAMSGIRSHAPEWKLFLARPVWQSVDESWRDTNGSD